MTDDMRSYALPAESISALDLPHHLHDIMEVRKFLESRGIETANTRLERYAQYLERVLRDGIEWVASEKIFKNSAGEPFRSPIDWFQYVLREVHELMWILKGLKIHVPTGVDEKLRLIVSGRDFAVLDKDSRSRDTQFELRIASYFCQSGCEVDMSADTDVIARMNHYTFLVECKRVGSKSKLGLRLSEARRQLTKEISRNQDKRRILGCIAAEVTKVAFIHNGLTFGITNEHSRDVIQEKLLQIAAEANHLMSFESCRELLCYWLQIHIPAFIMQPLPATFVTRFSSYHVSRPSLVQNDAKMLAILYGMFESTSKQDHRALPGHVLTPRKTVSFPGGTTFTLEGDRVIELLGEEAVSEDEKTEVIGTLTFNGTEHKFIFWEVNLLPGDLIEEWKNSMSIDRVKGSVMLLAELYLHRYPYVESERILQLGSPTVTTLAPNDRQE